MSIHLPFFFFVHLFVFFLVGFGLICVFVCSKWFRQKKKLAWNCLNNLIYYNTAEFVSLVCFKRFYVILNKRSYSQFSYGLMAQGLIKLPWTHYRQVSSLWTLIFVSADVAFFKFELYSKASKEVLVLTILIWKTTWNPNL